MFKLPKQRNSKPNKLTELRDRINRIHYRLVDLANRASSVRYDVELLLDDIDKQTGNGGSSYG